MTKRSFFIALLIGLLFYIIDFSLKQVTQWGVFIILTFTVGVNEGFVADFFGFLYLAIFILAYLKLKNKVLSTIFLLLTVIFLCELDVLAYRLIYPIVPVEYYTWIDYAVIPLKAIALAFIVSRKKIKHKDVVVK